MFKLPGPDHHARWMSKVIYNLKMKLVSKFFEMSEDEKEKVNRVVEFVLLFYTKYWFTTPLAGSAARQDLDFMSSILEYRKVNPSLSYTVLSSTYRHMWYLTPQMITLALTDKELEDSNMDGVARGVSTDRGAGYQDWQAYFPSS